MTEPKTRQEYSSHAITIVSPGAKKESKRFAEVEGNIERKKRSEQDAVWPGEYEQAAAPPCERKTP